MRLRRTVDTCMLMQQKSPYHPAKFTVQVTDREVVLMGARALISHWIRRTCSPVGSRSLVWWHAPASSHISPCSWGWQILLGGQSRSWPVSLSVSVCVCVCVCLCA